MAIEKAREYLKKWDMDSKIIEFDVSSATVELAAAALGIEGQRIAKTLSFQIGDGCILVVTAGDRKVDNQKFKSKFGVKAKMVAFDDVERLVGHAAGGVCPFGVNEGIAIYLDESLKRFETVFPAGGSSNSAIELTIPQLEMYSGYQEWVDVCKES